MTEGRAFYRQDEEYEYGLKDDDSDDECSIGYRPTIVRLLTYNNGYLTGNNIIASKVIMGLKRSGKTSIRKVVFQKMSPNETLFVESTARVTNECK